MRLARCLQSNLPTETVDDHATIFLGVPMNRFLFVSLSVAMSFASIAHAEGVAQESCIIEAEGSTPYCFVEKVTDGRLEVTAPEKYSSQITNNEYMTRNNIEARFISQEEYDKAKSKFLLKTFIYTIARTGEPVAIELPENCDALWWSSWGRCAAGTAGGALGGALAGASAGSTLPGVGTVGGAIIGGVAGGLAGASSSCGNSKDDDFSSENCRYQ